MKLSRRIKAIEALPEMSVDAAIWTSVHTVRVLMQPDCVVMRERSLLQLCVIVGGMVPVAAGLAGIVSGPHFVDATVGPAADSHFRYLSGLLLGIGLGFWSIVPHIETRGDRFRVLAFAVFVGGSARLFSAAAIGFPPAEMLFALAMELIVTPLLCLWQWRISVHR